MKEELTIRVAKPEDAKGLLEIYAPYVEKTAITFDDDVIIGLSQEISYKEAVSMI